MKGSFQPTVRPGFLLIALAVTIPTRWLYSTPTAPDSAYLTDEDCLPKVLDKINDLRVHYLAVCSAQSGVREYPWRWRWIWVMGDPV